MNSSQKLKRAVLVTGLLVAFLARAQGFPIDPRMDGMILAAMNDLYDINVTQSEKEFQQTIAQFPGEPLPHLFYAGSLWWRAAEQFQSSKSREPFKEKFDKEVGEAIQTAQAKAERLGKEDDEVCFVLGGAYGLAGRWEVLDGELMKAYGDGKKGRAYLKKAVKLNPQFYDAFLGLGIYDYYAATLSGFFRRIASAILLRGNKERGLRELRVASNLGHFTAVDAKLFLIDAYQKNKRDTPKALDLTLQLRKVYPQSPLFHYTEILLRFNLDDEEACSREALSYIERIRKHEGTYDLRQLPLPSVFLADIDIEKGNLQAAVQRLTEAISAAPDAPPAWLTFCYLRRAQAEDISGQRAEAIQDYKKVLDLPDFHSSHKQARPYLNKACTREEALKRIKES